MTPTPPNLQQHSKRQRPKQPRQRARREPAANVTLAGVELVADPSGAIYCPSQDTLLVADLHIEKGSAYAARGGALLPPYDTRATLTALDQVLRRVRPRRVICLGDSFHDAGASQRLSTGDAARVCALTRAHEWTWVVGNHDPQPPQDLGGNTALEVRLGGLVLRHAAATGDAKVAAEISGHYHPKARVRLRTGSISGRCFVTDGRRLILPSFGAYTGGLDVLDPALAALLRPRFRVLLMARGRLYPFAAHQLSVPPSAIRDQRSA